MQTIVSAIFFIIYVFKTFWAQFGDQLIDPTYTGGIVVPWLFTKFHNQLILHFIRTIYNKGAF